MRAAGLEIVNVDCTVVMETPKLSPHRQAIRRGSRGCSAGLARVNVKASTGEGMGFVGRGEGVAALAVAGLRRRQIETQGWAGRDQRQLSARPTRRLRQPRRPR